MFFDHVAILLDKIGVGKPEEGVGIFVNSDGSESEIELANLADAADCTREGWLNKTRFFFTNDSSYLFDQIQSAIGEKLRKGGLTAHGSTPSLSGRTRLFTRTNRNTSGKST